MLWRDPGRHFGIYVVLAAAALVAFSSLHFFAPPLAKSLTAEDNVIETLTAVLFLAGFVAALVSAAKVPQKIERLGYGLIAALALMGLMEEISFGARFFGLQPPALYSLGNQNKIAFCGSAYRLKLPQTFYRDRNDLLASAKARLDAQSPPPCSDPRATVDITVRHHRIDGVHDIALLLYRAYGNSFLYFLLLAFAFGMPLLAWKLSGCKSAPYLVAAAASVFVGGVLDLEIIRHAFLELLEELLELNAALALLFAALLPIFGETESLE